MNKLTWIAVTSLATATKLLVLVMSLGFDTPWVSIAVGSQLPKRDRWKVGLTLSTFETLMPLIGLVVGHLLGRKLGPYAEAVGAVLLIGVGLYLLLFENEESHDFGRPLMGWLLVWTALSVSLDELAVGFSISLVGLPILLTVFLIGIQAFVLSWIGLSIGRKIKPYTGEWTEKLGAAALILLGLWTGSEALWRLL